MGRSMKPKTRATVAITGVALGIVMASLGGASAASTAGGAFGIASVNRTDPTITGYAGMAEKSGNPGTTDPETPASCSLDLKTPTSFKANQYTDGVYMVPQDGGSYSHWVDQILDSGGTIKMGAPTAVIHELEIDKLNSAGGYDAENLTDVSFPELKLDAIQGKAIKANTGSYGSGVSQDTKDSAAYGSIQSPYSFTVDQYTTDPLVQSQEFFQRFGADFPERGYSVTGDPVLIFANSVRLSYPLTAEWPSDSPYSKCSASAVAESDNIYTGAL